jgi:hypothetical protein
MPLIAYKDCNFRGEKLALIETANRIIEDYRRQGYVLTLRQLYYQFVSKALIPNSERSYKNLGSAVSDGRDAGLIDWNGIEDRGRGVRPVYCQEDEQETLRGIEYGFALDYWQRQNAYVEVWVEKEALVSVIERPCSRLRVPYMACKGYLSASEAWRAGQRFQEKEGEGRERLVVIHLGDHDPSGIDMSRDNLDRLRLYSDGSRVELRRIALNMDQVDQYSPPPNPAKITDSRATDYIARFGRTSWELDALEPKVLDRLIEDTVREFIDPDIWEDTEAEEEERREVLSKLHDRWDDVSALVRDL